MSKLLSKYEETSTYFAATRTYFDRIYRINRMICQTASRRLNHIMDQVIFLHQIVSLVADYDLLSATADFRPAGNNKNLFDRIYRINRMICQTASRRIYKHGQHGYSRVLTELRMNRNLYFDFYTG